VTGGPFRRRPLGNQQPRCEGVRDVPATHRVLRAVRAWQLWSLRPRAKAYILLIDAAYVGAVVGALLTARWHATDLMTAVVLAGCAMVSIEGSLRFVWRRPTPSSQTNDLMGAWTLPIALLLPPLLAAIAILPVSGFFYLRVMRRSPMKWCFNTAALGLAGFLAAEVHRALQPAGSSGVAALVGGAAATLATLAAVGVRQVVNEVLVAEVIALTTRGGRGFRTALSDAEGLGVTAAETCTGVLVAMAYAAAPFAVLFAIPPVLVLQRTLLLSEFREAARTDAKTGLANSSYWREVAERELLRARSGHEPLAVLIVDVDHFKSVNDRFGHLTGDEVLRAVANALTLGLRPRDFVGRFGGEEFVVLLAGSDLEQARHAGERIREHVAEVVVMANTRREPVQVTVSVGVAAFRESGHSVHELLDAADTALYDAKNGGRNCVRVARRSGQQVLDLTGDRQRVIEIPVPGRVSD
jgi:diguanylate cyclase (GGDEF)-like protein